MISSMKKLLAIVVLGLLLTSCAQQNRDDEYSCSMIGGTETKLINITKDSIIEPMFTYPIKKETKDKIYAVLFEKLLPTALTGASAAKVAGLIPAGLLGITICAVSQFCWCIEPNNKVSSAIPL